jgi:type I restriction enzyme S subunit
LVPDPDVLHGEYLYLAIQSKVGARKLVEHTATSAFPNLKPTFFVDPWVPLPPLDVQRRIVDLIKHVDMHLANLKDETQAARSMLIRVGGQSDGMPSNPLGSRVRARGGKRMPKGVPFAEGPTSHPYLRIVDLVDGTIRSDGLEYVPDEVFPTIRRYTVRPNEVVISIVGTIGRVAVVPDWADGANLTENAAVVDVLGDQLNAEWLTYWLMSDPGQREIKRVTVGTSQGKLALSRIPLIEVPSLGLERQAELAGVATALQMVVRSLDQEAEAVSALRASLLHRLLDGTIQLPDAYAPLPVGLE